MRNYVWACLIICASGCTTTIPSITTDPAKVPAETLQKAQTVTIMTVKPENAEYLGPVQATSCRRTRWEPLPTDDLTLTLFKAAVADKGGNAVIDLEYVRTDVNLALKCYESITAKGIAFKVNQ